MEKITDHISIDQLATLFKLPDGCNDYETDTYHYVYTNAIDEGLTDAEATEAALRAEQTEQDEFYFKWYDAVHHVSEHFFNLHGLDLKTFGNPKGRPFEYKIVPTKSWNVAAASILETINGVGYFYFDSLKDFLDSGPYTARQATLTHIHWLKDYAEVYGADSPRRVFDRYMR